mmetsp:Transcript_3139/g.6379  ORF Transcript_3139/g.6379 Transcript_3139/m.6379 type:complete len:210 (-) Transcript_3139:1395-2024(-)
MEGKKVGFSNLSLLDAEHAKYRTPLLGGHHRGLLRRGLVRHGHRLLEPTGLGNSSDRHGYNRFWPPHFPHQRHHQRPLRMRSNVGRESIVRLDPQTRQRRAVEGRDPVEGTDRARIFALCRSDGDRSVLIREVETQFSPSERYVVVLQHGDHLSSIVVLEGLVIPANLLDFHVGPRQRERVVHAHHDQFEPAHLRPVPEQDHHNEEEQT